MENNVRKQEAEKLTEKIKENDDLLELEQMLKNNFIEWKDNSITYRVRKPNFGEQQELRKAKVKKHSELRADPNYKYEKQLIVELEKKGISISKIIDKQLEINRKIEELELQLAKLGNEKEEEIKAITDYKIQIFNLMTERNSLAMEKMELLSDSIENELIIFINSFACSMVLEQKESGDNWSRVFNSYEEFIKSDNSKLVEKASYYLSLILFRQSELTN
jgi:enoyl reductase-like protein